MTVTNSQVLNCALFWYFGKFVFVFIFCKLVLLLNKNKCNKIIKLEIKNNEIEIFLITALKLSIKGEATVSWERRKTTKNSQGHSHTQVDHFRANELYFHQHYYLLGNSTGRYVILSMLPKVYNAYYNKRDWM